MASIRPGPLRLRRTAVCLAVAVAAAAGPAAAQLRNVRYCEVIAVHERGGALVGDVWNSLAAGDPCLPDAWAALDPEAIRQELGAVAVLLNGLRYWQLDFIAAPPPEGERRLFGQIAMRLAATVSVPDGATAAYTDFHVTRDTQFLFRAGRPVYELIDPDGRTYVMQSYSQAVDPALGEDDLADLGARLALPPGWIFRTRVPDADLVVEDQAGIATVTTDDLENTYQYAGRWAYPAGRRLVVRRGRGGDARLRLLARDGAIVPDAPCEVDGDLVIEARGAGAPPIRVPLEPGGWRRLRGPRRDAGCRYQGSGLVRDIRLRAGALRLVARASDLGIPLDDDSAPVRIRLRHGERNYCVTFGGDVRGRAGRRLVARDAPPRDACPSTPLGP